MVEAVNARREAAGVRASIQSGQSTSRHLCRLQTAQTCLTCLSGPPIPLTTISTFSGHSSTAAVQSSQELNSLGVTRFGFILPDLT